MKKYCFNYEDCGWVEYITEEELKKLDFKNPFFSCPECKNIAAVVRNDFTLQVFEKDETPVNIKDEN
jgi:hypothetical protein